MKNWGFVLCLAQLVALAAQAEQEPIPSIYGESVDVRLVNIEVVVTDGKDQRVSGLGPEDFRLLVDGKEVEISNFSEIREGAVTVEDGSVSSSGPAAAVEAGQVPTRYLVYIDDFFSIPQHRNRVLDRLAEQIDGLSPGDSMALVAFNGRKLDLLAPWSSSPTELRAAVAKAKERRAYGIVQRVAREQSVNDPGAGEQLELPSWVPRDGSLNTQQRAYAQQLEMQLRNEVRAAQSALRAMSAIEGRKVFLILAGGWPHLTQEHASISQPTFPQGGLSKVGGLYQPLIATANRLGFTVYPIDVPGIGASGPEAATDPGFDASSGPGVIDRSLPTSDTNLEATLSIIARETGGRPLLNSLRDRALETAVADTRSFYWLGFVPDRRGDGREHEIKFKMKPKGLSARFRQSFHDLSRSAELSMMVEAWLLFGEVPSDRLLPVKVGEIAVSGKKMKVPLLVGIPVDEVTILKIGEEYVAELELRIGALDAKANMTDVQVTPIRLSSKNQPRSGKLVRYDTQLELWKEKHELIVSLFDPATGKLLSTRLNVAPQP